MYLQLETGLIFGPSALAENNQYQYIQFWTKYKGINPQENITGYMSSPPLEISNHKNQYSRKYINIQPNQKHT